MGVVQNRRNIIGDKGVSQAGREEQKSHHQDRPQNQLLLNLMFTRHIDYFTLVNVELPPHAKNKLTGEKMSKKTAIVLAIVVGLAFLCLCGVLFFFFVLGSGSTPNTPTIVPSVPTTAPSTQPQAPTITPSPVLGNSKFDLNGTTMFVSDVSYTIMNGGERGVDILMEPDKYYLLVTILSDEKDLGFIYDQYGNSIILTDPSQNRTIEYDYVYWSSNDTYENIGYAKISFPISEPLTKAVLHFKEGLDIDLTSLLPSSTEIEDPFIDAQQPFTIDGITVEIESLEVFEEYVNPYEGTPIQKENPTDTILVLTVVSSQGDMTYFSTMPPYILIDGNDPDIQYEPVYTIWTTAENTERGELIFIYVVPEYIGTYVIYIPYETLLDLTPMLSGQ